ncbi:MAG: hypothetical protein J0L73_24880 [Verrucomicrobia bacterium]|nr:hypothetical protein [Verrucomicrobiota bacterium]
MNRDFMLHRNFFSPLLADSGGGFSFSGFQQSFHDAWGFVFPNGMLLLLCLAVAWYVGRVKIPSLRTPVDRTKEGVAALAKFLEESNLFGSKLFPAVILLMAVLAALNVFSVLRVAAHNVLPPQLVTMPANLYQRHVDADLFLQMLAREPGVKYPEEVFRRLHDYERQMEHEAEDDPSLGSYYWGRDAGEWAGYAGDLKLLAAVAAISCLFGLRQRRWGSIPRCLVTAGLLGVGYVYCLTKELYAREQVAYSVLSSYQKKMLEAGNADASQLMEQGMRVMEQHPGWAETMTSASTAWWSLRWIDVNFYARTLDLLRGGINESRGKMHPLIGRDQLQSIKERLAWEKAHPPASAPAAQVAPAALVIPAAPAAPAAPVLRSE